MEKKLFRIPTNQAPIEFWGEMVASIGREGHFTDGGQPFLRWTDMALYRYEESGTGVHKFLLQTIGRSLLYHGVGSPCNKGFRTQIETLSDERFDEIQPCSEPRCNPPQPKDLSDDSVVMLETDYYSEYYCKNVNEVIGNLQRRDSKGSTNLRSVTVPGQRLLRAAAEVDAEFAAALLAPRRL